jgi:hypothetical protein
MPPLNFKRVEEQDKTLDCVLFKITFVECVMVGNRPKYDKI